MAFKSNIKAFYQNNTDPLFVSYRLLVAIELALKDAKYPPLGSHDIPSMLANAARSPTLSVAPAIAPQLLSLSAKLKRDLGAITCQDKKGAPQSVPPASYPYIRYSRCAGDWGGASETPLSNLIALRDTCQSICSFLSTHRNSIGVSI